VRTGGIHRPFPVPAGGFGRHTHTPRSWGPGSQRHGDTRCWPGNQTQSLVPHTPPEIIHM